MHSSRSADVYTPREIARAASVPFEDVVATVGHPDVLVRHSEAVQIGRALRGRKAPAAPLFANHTAKSRRPIFFALSSTLHASVFAGILFLTTFTIGPVATALKEDAPREEARLIFLATPGPGGGGGGGGLLQPTPPPRAKREGKKIVSSPVPARRPPKPIEPPPRPKLPEPLPPPPPLQSEPLPILAAPIVAMPAESNDRLGVFEPASGEKESHGPGQGGGTGTGTGTGVGPGQGAGLGPGSGGGTGGGPFRPGSGIAAPRLLREVKADYTEDARRRGIEGEVVMEIVVGRDGTVGETKILRRLGAGLDERAVQAVRQWRFSPATRQGAPVDVLVEVSVEFRLR